MPCSIWNFFPGAVGVAIAIGYPFRSPWFPTRRDNFIQAPTFRAYCSNKMGNFKNANDSDPDADTESLTCSTHRSAIRLERIDFSGPKRYAPPALQPFKRGNLNAIADRISDELHDTNGCKRRIETDFSCILG